MITTEQLRDVVGATAYDNDGDKIGKIGNVYSDDESGTPTWFTVHTGFFGGNETFVPMQGSEFAGEGRVTTSYDKATVKDAPNVSADGHLSVEEEEQLFRYYNLDSATATSGADSTTTTGSDTGVSTGAGVGTAAGYDRQDTTTTDDRRDVTSDRRDLAGESDVVGRDTSGPTTDKAMTRSEEQLRVGTETRDAGTARLRKYIVSEDVSTTVPVSHEEVTLHREPITDANMGAAMSGGDLTEEEHEVTLREERAVVDKEVVPVERVRLGTETHTEQQQVNESVRKEVIDTDGVENSGRHGVASGERELTDSELADRDRTGR